jgi:hypothetical protein
MIATATSSSKRGAAAGKPHTQTVTWASSGCTGTMAPASRSATAAILAMTAASVTRSAHTAYRSRPRRHTSIASAVGPSVRSSAQNLAHVSTNPSRSRCIGSVYTQPQVVPTETNSRDSAC